MSSKIIRTLRNLLKNFYFDFRYFNIVIAIYRFNENVFHILHLKKISLIFLEKKNKRIIGYLKNNYGYIFNNYKTQSNTMIKNNMKSPIWICWFDGVDNAPPLVQKCIESIKKNSGTHPVNMITWDNIDSYIEIPDYILEKVKNGIIQLPHFADILRVCLLGEYGGLWLDSTIYCKETIPERYFEYSFFTCKNVERNIRCVSKNQWTTFCLGGYKGNIFFYALKDFFYKYWEQENHAIDYLFFDDAIEIARSMLPMVDKMINNVPNNNIYRDRLISKFDQEWKEGCLDEIFNTDTVLFKLGYKEKRYLNNYTKDGRKTIYYAFLNNFKI